MRERSEDISIIAAVFTRNFCQENNLPWKELSAGAAAKLSAYNFPGKIGELKNTIIQAVIASEKLDILVNNLLQQGKGAGYFGLIGIEKN